MALFFSPPGLLINPSNYQAMGGCILSAEKLYYWRENCGKACLLRKEKPASGVLDTQILIVKEPTVPLYSKQALFL
jgi:hypothetical protein